MGFWVLQDHIAIFKSTVEKPNLNTLQSQSQTQAIPHFQPTTYRFYWRSNVLVSQTNEKQK